MRLSWPRNGQPPVRLSFAGGRQQGGPTQPRAALALVVRQPCVGHYMRASLPGRWDDLAGIEDVVRIQRLLDAGHQADGLVAGFLAQEGPLVQADAVLAI